MPFEKGNKHGKGRKRGSVNAVPAALKDIILGALDKAGGLDYLALQAKKNPNAFLSLVGRVLPLQMKADNSDPMMPTVVKHVYLDNPDKV